MTLAWIHENPPRWDAGKAAIVGGAPRGTFVLADHRAGEPIPGEWWRVEEDGRVVGYGWMDTTWNGAEVLLAVDPAARRHGVGTFIMDGLEREAARRGLHYLYNVVRHTHPDRDGITRWLLARGFTDAGDGELRRQVKVKA
jgi:GNAT superfamily N-acetyltransferase